MKKLPPIEKVFEAWTAIADNRVDLTDNSATVSSSDGTKSYKVNFRDNLYSSDDNATFWQGYPGYPVIAVLMLQGKLPLDRAEADLWKDINWTELNKKNKNNYAKAVKEVADLRGINLDEAYEAAQKVMEALTELPIEIKRKIPEVKK